MCDEPRKLPKQPLTLVLAEFCYSPLLKIEKHIPDIQEMIRKSYPLLNRADQQTVQVADQEISVTKASQWIFTSQDLRSAVRISSDRLVFVTSRYERFPEFSDRCLDVLSTLKEIVDPTLLLRIGLRYNDHIVFEDLDHATELVDAQLIPNIDFVSLGTGVNHHRIETSIQTSEGALQIRSLLGKHGYAVMPDLSQTLPVKLEVAGEPDKVALLLDFDHSWSAEEPGVSFELAVAKDHLDRLHDTARAAFWKATTEHARSNLWT